jgi:DoxX-like family
MTPREWIAIANGCAFIAYGGSLIFSSAMVSDFERFGLARFRVLTGALEVLGGIGVLAGLRWPPLLQFSAAGLCVLMLGGAVVRLRSGDPLVMIVPAILFLLLNGYLTVKPRLG